MADQHDPEQELIDKLKKRLRKSETEIDAATTSRLHQIRRVALEALPNNDVKTMHHWPNWLVPTSTVAATLGIGVLVFNLTVDLPNETDFHENETLSVMNDIAILTAPDDLELYQDLEFYEWLTYSKELDKA